MFDQIKAMGALAGLMKNKDRLQDAVRQFQQSLEGMSATGAAGGGAVRVTVTGKMKVTQVMIDPGVAAGMGRDEASRKMAEALIVEAANDALGRVQLMARDEAGRQARELGLPELPGLEGLLG